MKTNVLIVSDKKEKVKENQMARMLLLGGKATDMAHELNNLLAKISIGCYLIDKSPDLNENAKHSVAIASAACEQAGSIVNYILNLSGVKKTPEIVSLKDIFQNILMIERYEIEKQGLTITMEIDNIRIKCLLNSFFIIFFNLINNAIEAMAGGGELKIYSRVGKTIEICVSDNGCGIPRKIKSNIFKSRLTTKPKGHGIGLRLVQEEVEKMNGKISIETGSDKGTIFKVELPLSMMVGDNCVKP